MAKHKGHKGRTGTSMGKVTRKSLKAKPAPFAKAPRSWDALEEQARAALEANARRLNG